MIKRNDVDFGPGGQWYRMYGKRWFDVMLAVILCVPVLCAVLCLMLPLVIRGQRALYRHIRVGRGGRVFACWKIRTMAPMPANEFHRYLRSNPVAHRAWQQGRKLPHDPRVSGRYCQFLRDTHLDELPQLFNILLGHMSFVGPRPVSVDEARLYHVSLTLRPGLTGLWQIERSAAQPWSERQRLDARYWAGLSLRMDASLILRTCAMVIRRVFRGVVRGIRLPIWRYVPARAIRR